MRESCLNCPKNLKYTGIERFRRGGEPIEVIQYEGNIAQNYHVRQLVIRCVDSNIHQMVKITRCDKFL
jgi:hypothetical protein